MRKKQKNPSAKPDKVVVELTQTGLLIRVALIAVAVVVASFAFYSVFRKVLHAEPGWQTVPAARTETGIGEEFVLQYEFGTDGNSAAQEWVKLTKKYPELLDRAEKIFDVRWNLPTDESEKAAKEEMEIAGISMLNHHPNEILRVEPELYDALMRFESADDPMSRYLFLAPVYELYRGLFACENDWEAEAYDPAENAELAGYVKEVLSFVNDPDSIQIKLLGDSQVSLIVSEEYLAFAEENEIETYVDFFYLKNAFVTDHVASALAEEGFTTGFLSCADGYTRSLGDRPFATTFFTPSGHETAGQQDSPVTTVECPVSTAECPVSTVECPAGSAAAALYGSPVSPQNQSFYYEREDGRIRNAFIDPADGLCRAQEKELLAYSEEYGCAELMMIVLPRFMEEGADSSGLFTDGISILTAEVE